ncbi:MAG TPA: hypothetical protein VMV79_01695 [Alphaproteobacteria bacterium]|nr:hypothetical protein [Alphaproteobacteria bacterium]
MPRPSSKKTAFAAAPWSCAQRADGVWEIEATSPASGRREVIAEIRPAKGLPPPRLAAFIVEAVNDMPKRACLIEEMRLALEMCLECEGLDWSAEHDAEIVLRHAKG